MESAHGAYNIEGSGVGLGRRVYATLICMLNVRCRRNTVAYYHYVGFCEFVENVGLDTSAFRCISI